MLHNVAVHNKDLELWMTFSVLLFYLYSVKFSTRVETILPEAFNNFSLSRWLQLMLSSLYIHLLSINKNYVIAFDAI